MNNKGLIWYQGCVVMAAAYTVFAFASTSMKDPNAFSSFRAKKALQHCTEAGNTDCKETISKMSKDEVLAYIKR